MQIVVEITSGEAVQRERVNEGSGEVKHYSVQECYVHVPGRPYPDRCQRNIAKGEKPLPPGRYLLDPTKPFVNFSWGRVEFSLRHLVPEGAVASKAPLRAAG